MAPAVALPTAAARPPWAVGRATPLSDVPFRYRDALRSIAWSEGKVPDDEIMVPLWAMRVCSLSRRGRSLLLRAWLEWCAEAGGAAEQRALLIQNMARLMRPEEALRAINQMVHGGS
jgi:hypothetical protein